MLQVLRPAPCPNRKRAGISFPQPSLRQSSPPGFLRLKCSFCSRCPARSACGCVPAGACLQDVFDLPVLGRSSGSSLVPRILPFVSQSSLAICFSTREPFQEQYSLVSDAEMSTKYFLPNLGSSHSQMEDVVARRLGRTARVDECVHQVCSTDSWLSHE
jgi:hypothetical protein